MSRKEFMGQLEMLLQDISPEERQEALQYYNDYLDEAGEGREMEVIRELGSPEKLAAEILSGLSGEDDGEFRETGYANPQFEEKDSPQVWSRQEKRSKSRADAQKEYKETYYQDGGYQNTGYRSAGEGYDSSTGYNPNYRNEKKNTSTAAKVLLILGIIFIGIPILLPLGIGFALLVFGLLAGAVALAAGLGIGCVAVAFSGVIVFIYGLTKLAADLSVGFMFMGGGLMMGTAGVIGTVIFVKLCLVVLPALFRGIVNLVRKPFQRKAV